jgi:signal transduction histidine kinase
VRLLRGGVLARTHNSPSDLGFAGAGYSTRTIQGVRWRSYTLDQDGIRITTADRVDRRTALLKDIVVATAVPFLIAMMGSLLALGLGIRHGLAPLGLVRKALADRDPNALQRLPETRVPGELHPLVSTINSLLDRIQQAMERERRFTGDAAHELRTPLTAVKTHIQVARLANGGSETALALLHAEEGVLRLQSTIEQLLMLARVDGAQSFDGEEAVGAAEIVAMAMQGVPGGQRERIILHDLGASGKSSVPAILAVTAVRNILDNALRYSPPDKHVVLTIAASDGMMNFAVDDSGPGMSESECTQSLERFWRKGRGHGSGLGLSIVAAITERYGGKFELRPLPEGGMRASIGFPVA